MTVSAEFQWVIKFVLILCLLKHNLPFSKAGIVPKGFISIFLYTLSDALYFFISARP
jgi:hypothetical protein